MPEFATAVPGLSFRKKPRAGQADLFAELTTTHRDRFNVKFPTGYGKTFACAGAYSILHHRGLVSRLLMVVTSTTQLDQFCNDASYDFRDAGVPTPLKIIDIGYHGVAALKAHRSHAAQLFVITVQALKERRGMDNVRALLQSGQWMVCIDEYHHYGLDCTWGLAIAALPRKFLLAMSATPFRPNDDSAFGKPDLTVTYRQGQQEPAVKELVGHAYNFRVDVIDEDGVEHNYTTAQIEEMAGSSDPDRIEKFRIQRKVRWSPKYVSPLVCNPIDRMMSDRLTTGHKLQALVCAMCVSHAEFVCEQLRGLYPESWSSGLALATPAGRGKKTNASLVCFVRRRGKMESGPNQAFDVLVHVGIAGEGLDSTTVSEIVFLSNATISNRALQIIGRAARILSGQVVGNVNFDSSCEFAKKGYIGHAIMDAMDFADPKAPDDDDTPTDPTEPTDLPDEPAIQIFNVELLNIDSGDYSVQSTARTMAALWPQDFNYQELKSDGDHPKWSDVIAFHRTMKTVEARDFNDKAILAQWDEAVETAVRLCTNRIIALMKKQGRPIEHKLIGAIKKAINTRKKQYFGEKQKDLEVLKHHYNWCKALERDIKREGHPAMVSVSIDSGPIEATNQLRYVPQEKWRDLVRERRRFIKVHISYDCRCLVQFIADAEEMHGPLGFQSAEDMVRQGYDLDPEEINVAVEWLKHNPPDEPLALDQAVKLGRHGGDRKSEKAKGQPDTVRMKTYGNRADYILARLDRDGHTELAAKVRAGEMSANAAAIDAGFRKVATPLELILKLLPKLTPTERRQLQARLDEMRRRVA